MFKLQCSNLNVQSNLFLFLSVIQCDVASLTGSDSNGIQYWNHEDSAVAYFTCLGCPLDGCDGWFHVLITNHDVQEHTLDAAVSYITPR